MPISLLLYLTGSMPIMNMYGAGAQGAGLPAATAASSKSLLFHSVSASCSCLYLLRTSVSENAFRLFCFGFLSSLNRGGAFPHYLLSISLPFDSMSLFSNTYFSGSSRVQLEDTSLHCTALMLHSCRLNRAVHHGTRSFL